MSTLHILDSSGDTTLTWPAATASKELIDDVESAFATAQAEAKFKEMLAKGYRAHMTSSPTDTGNDAVLTRDWNEASTAAAVIMVPQTVGG